MLLQKRSDDARKLAAEQKRIRSMEQQRQLEIRQAEEQRDEMAKVHAQRALLDDKLALVKQLKPRLFVADIPVRAIERARQLIEHDKCYQPHRRHYTAKLVSVALNVGPITARRYLNYRTKMTYEQIDKLMLAFDFSIYDLLHDSELAMVWEKLGGPRQWRTINIGEKRRRILKKLLDGDDTLTIESEPEEITSAEPIAE